MSCITNRKLCSCKNNIIHNHYHHHHPVGTVVHKITDSVTEQRVQKMIEDAVSTASLNRQTSQPQLTQQTQQCPVTEQRVLEVVDNIFNQNQQLQTQNFDQKENTTVVTKEEIVHLIDQNSVTEQKVREIVKQNVIDENEKMLVHATKLVNDLKNQISSKLITEQRVQELIDNIEQPERQTQQCPVTKQKVQEIVDTAIEQNQKELNQKVLSIIEKMIAECKLKTEHEVRKMVSAVKFEKQKERLHNVFNYPSFDNLNISYGPTILRTGHPYTLICGKDLTEHTRLIILSHIFDQDKVHGDDLTLMYNLLAETKDGNINTKPGPRLRLSNYRHGNKNYYTLNLTLKISDFYDNINNIAFLSVVIARTSNVSYGTESVLDVVIEY